METSERLRLNELLGEKKRWKFKSPTVGLSGGVGMIMAFGSLSSIGIMNQL